MSISAAMIVFTVCFASSFVLTFFVRGMMRRLGVLDMPEEGRKTHPTPVAYEGGLAMFGAFIVGIPLLLYLQPDAYYEVWFFSSRLLGLITGAALAVALGAADDILDVNPLLKLAGQLGIGVLMFLCDYRIEKISNPLGSEILFAPWMSLLVTVFWYALLMNSINLIDGLDGLAAGVVAISAAAVAMIALSLGQDFSVGLALIIAAICFGFLPFNFRPATIFMGDSGSLLLGFLLASATLLSSTKAPALLALLVPLLAVGLPIFDAVFAFVRRAARGTNPFRGDRKHIHHRLLNLGLGEKRTVLIFYYVTAFFGGCAYVLQLLDARATLVVVTIIGVGLLLFVETLRALERDRT